MRGTHWGKGTIGLQTAVQKRPHTRPLTLTLTGDKPLYVGSFSRISGHSRNRELYRPKTVPFVDPNDLLMNVTYRTPPPGKISLRSV